MGIELIFGSFGTFDDKLFAFLSNQQVDTNYLQLITGFILLIGGIYFHFYIKNKMYILNINGYFDKRIEHHQNDLNLSPFEFKEKEIDFIRLYRKGINEAIAQEIQEELSDKIEAFKVESRDKKRAYTGIAPIPFIMLAGKFFERHVLDEYFEYNKLNDVYYELTNCKTGWTSRPYPQLVQNPPLDSLGGTQEEEIVIAVSVTSQITDEDTAQFSCPKIYLSLPQPMDYAIKYKEQLKDYCNAVYMVLMDTQQAYPNIKKIHLLYSGQSCLAFELGKLMDDNRMVQIISYQYDRQRTIKYPWGIVLNGTQKGSLVTRDTFLVSA
ncbi:2-methylthioadenine synthetase [Brevibacillus agri BAB-2500]|nr:2-methylthioadenine synthetase [Brevibacillus agri BAB-2500]